MEATAAAAVTVNVLIVTDPAIIVFTEVDTTVKAFVVETSLVRNRVDAETTDNVLVDTIPLLKIATAPAATTENTRPIDLNTEAAFAAVIE